MLTPDFRFSQHSLGDFAECPKRFYLRHVARQAWPLVETGPQGMDALTYREYLRRGAVLHRWIERFWLDLLPADFGPLPALDGADDRELAVWWARFQATDFSDLSPPRLPELELSAPLGDFRLYARFDLLAGAQGEAAGDGSGRLVIVDWKTLRGERPPSFQFLKQRLQTRVYLYVLATAGAPFNGGTPIEPERCVMRYWLANFPEQPWVEIPYSRAEYERDGARLLALAQAAAGCAAPEAFQMTADEQHCTYCTYRTLCHRRGAQDAPVFHDDEEIIPARGVQSLEY